jgi:phosphate starvation-inducible PhoH-like protein
MAKNYQTQTKKFSWQPATENQTLLRQTILDKQVTFVIGPPGVGKTFVSIMTALELLDKTLKNGGVKKIIAVRPLVTNGKGFGFLPGDLNDKIDPFMRAVFDTLEKSDHPKSQALLEKDGLEFIPLEVSRSLTFDDSYAFLDEAQNTTPQQMEMFLTRLGPNSKAVISGDLNQKDFLGLDGLTHAKRLFENHPLFGFVELGLEDIQRAGIVRDIVIAYAQDRELKLRAA